VPLTYWLWRDKSGNIVASKHPDSDNGKNGPRLWEKSPTPNLIRYVPSGTYFLRGRFGGEPLRESLETDNYRAAKARLANRMVELRSRTIGRHGPATLHAALAVVLDAVQKDPTTKQRSKDIYARAISRMLPGGRVEIGNYRLSEIDNKIVRDWWHRTSATFAPPIANQILMFMQRAIQLGEKKGLVRGDPMEGIRRMQLKRTRLRVLTPDQFRQLVASIRSMGRMDSEESANFVAFAAFSGMRPSEIIHLEWGDIGPDEITVRGGPTGTKNRHERPVPIIPPMRELLQAMKRRGPRDRVFRIESPRKSLAAACQRLQLPRVNVYGLRHLFASTCVAAGVDIPVLAKWLGHRDGGSLAMRTYVHSSDEHSQRSAEKVTFK
jgi:integrase